MKTFKALIPIALFMAMFACSENSVQPTTVETLTDEIAVNDITDVDQYVTDLEMLLDELGVSDDNFKVVTTRGPECPSVQSDNERGQFPITITIDFGSGCTAPNGDAISGKIVVYKSGPLHQAGSEHVMTFYGLTRDSAELNGTRTNATVSVDSSGNTIMSRIVDIQVSFPSGATVSRFQELIHEQIAGGSTRRHVDDVFQITGSGQFTGRDGIVRRSTIEEAIVRGGDCRWPTTGVVTFTTEGPAGAKSSVIDYGAPDAGSCDNKALLTLPDGSTREIRIGKLR